MEDIYKDDFSLTLKFKCNDKFEIIDANNLGKTLFSILLTKPRRDSKKELTAYEKELLKYIAKGEGNKEIAKKLYFSVNTIKAQIKKIFQKLNVATRTKSVVVAINNNLLDISEFEIPKF